MLNYSEKHTERLHPKIEEALNNSKHSLGKHPAFPEDNDTMRFDEGIISNAFKKAIKRLKQYLDVDAIDNESLIKLQLKLLKQCVELEKEHKKELEEIAVNFIKQEFNVPEEEVELKGTITDKIVLGQSGKTKTESAVEFNDHEHLKSVNSEIYKRRMVNSLIQGCSDHTVYKFINTAEDEISEVNPRLLNLYSKICAINDYLLFTVNGSKKGVIGGEVSVEINKKEDSKVNIEAEGVILPVLVHELSKGCMELISENGFEENIDENIINHIKSKADNKQCEKWDRRLGKGLWDNFSKNLKENTNGILYKVFATLVSKPVSEFNDNFKEIYIASNKGKLLLEKLAGDIKRELEEYSFHESLENKRNDFKQNQYISAEELESLKNEEFV